MRAPRRRTRWTLCVFLANTPTLTGCLAMSSYQSARMTTPGPARPTVALSSMGPADEPDEERITVIDLRVRKNLIPERADFGFLASVYTLEDNYFGSHSAVAVGVEPRFAIVDNWVAIGVPIVWPMVAPVVEYAPGVIVTLPLSRYFEVNAAARLFGFASQEGADTTSPVYSVGLAFSNDVHRWAIRPEVALMKPTDDPDDWIVQFGVGVDLPAGE